MQRSMICIWQPASAEWGLSDVTHILSAIDSGDPTAAEQLLPLYTRNCVSWQEPHG